MILEIMNTKDFSSFKKYSVVCKSIFTYYINVFILYLQNCDIAYNFQGFYERLKNMNFLMSDDLNSGGEYDYSSNTITIKSSKMNNDEFSIDELTEIIIHELWHAFCLGDRSQINLFLGFDEFFAQYLTYEILKNKTDDSVLTTDDRKVRGGYFSENDNELMQKLVDVFGFKKIIELYLNSNDAEVLDFFGEEVLFSFTNLLLYYRNLFSRFRKITVVEMHWKLEPRFYNEENEEIDALVMDSHKKINELKQKKSERVRTD